MKKYAKTLLKVLVSAGLIAFLYFKVDKQALVETISHVNLAYTPLIILLLVLNYFISSVRWKFLLLESRSKVSVWYLTSLYFIGSFFNNFMPTSIGGDVYKIYRLGKKIGDSSRGFSSTFMERFTGIIVLGLISIFGLTRYIGWFVILVVFAFGIGIFVGLKFLKVISHKFPKLKPYADSLYSYRHNKSVVYWALVTSIIVQLCAIFTQYFIFIALGAELPLWAAFMFFPLITLASFFIPSLNGIGVQDTLYRDLFVLVNIASPVALSASILYHISRLTVSLIGGLLYAAGKD